MKKHKRSIAALVASALAISIAAGCSSSQPYLGNTCETVLEDGDVFAVISVMDYGDITVKLFPKTAPKAVARFIKLAESDYYDGRTFHRVVKDQIVQGGSLTGTGYDGSVAKEEYFPVETSDYMRHYYGAVCMAKNTDGNYCQFYIVNNNTPADIAEIVTEIRGELADESVTAGLLQSDKDYYTAYCNKLSNYPDEVKERYAQVGGIYDLDGEDTVFGQVVDGWDVLAAINEVETVSGNSADDKNGVDSKPLYDIVIETVEVVRIAPAETTTEAKTRASRTTAAEETEEITTTDNIVVNGGEGTAETVSADDSAAPDETSEENASETAEDTSEPDGTAEETTSALGAETDENGQTSPTVPEESGVYETFANGA